MDDFAELITKTITKMPHLFIDYSQDMRLCEIKEGQTIFLTQRPIDSFTIEGTSPYHILVRYITSSD